MSKTRQVVEQITPDEKMEIIRSGKRRRSLTGVKENRGILFENKGGKYVAVETERKFEEAGVTKKKQNFIMFESKLGTEKDIDYTRIAGPKTPAMAQPRTEERIVQKSKKIPYLDNYQYKESKVFGKNPKPAVVIHTRLGEIIGGFSEEYSYQKITTTTAGNIPPKKQTETKTTTKTVTTTKTMKENKSSSDLRGKPTLKGPGETTATATKERISTTKVGRRGGAGGATSTTTETTSKTTTTRITRRGGK